MTQKQHKKTTPSRLNHLICLMPDSISSGLGGSLLLGVEQSGGKFCHPSDHTCTPVPALQMTKEVNYQWTRLQVVEPNGEYGLFQDLQYTRDTAKEAKSYGLKFLLAFHCSHWWAAPENQWTPTSWLEEPSTSDESTLSLEQCQHHIFKHTKEVMQALKDQGTLPDAVQIGNAVTNGIMWGTGHLPDHWEDFCQLDSEWNRRRR